MQKEKFDLDREVQRWIDTSEKDLLHQILCVLQSILAHFKKMED